MGDTSKTAIYSELLGYLSKRGIDLSAFGSAERGLRKHDAFEFIDMLTTNHVLVLGLEPWRTTAAGYNIDSTGVWASDSSNSEAGNAVARSVLERLFRLGSNDVVTIQF